jgi:predicted 2-oxoglutarate/Fe(II)-dependent dioxygenase YbiX
LTRIDLVRLIGSDAVAELEQTFGQRYDEIIIRRCEAHGKFINFHTDVSLRTMQVALNGDDEYKGGNLVFATQGKLHAPERRAGTVSIHENDIVHGVSMLHSGVRYGLFFLQKEIKLV